MSHADSDLYSLKEDFPGLIIDPKDYIKIGKIGKGGYSEVWLAMHKNSERSKYAYKELTKTLTEKQARQFAREIRTMASAKHPFFLQVIGFSPNPPLIMISQYHKNGSLYSFIRNPSRSQILTGTKRTIIVMGLAHAMASLHKIGIIHRDLKSMNILLDRQYRPRLCDFGIARFVDDETMTSRIGTPHWMAPEMLAGEQYGPKVDVYSFGMVLYELITNKLPWGKMQPVEIITNVCVQKKRPPLPKNTPIPMQRLFAECCAHNPDDRPSFIQIYERFENHEVEFPDTDPVAVNELSLFLNGSLRNCHTIKRRKTNCAMSLQKKVPKLYKSRVHSIDDAIRGERLIINFDNLNPTKPEFKQEMIKSIEFLSKSQCRDFFRILSRYFKPTTDPVIFKIILNTSARIFVAKPFAASAFVDLELHLKLPLDELLFECSMNLLIVLFRIDPVPFQDGFQSQMSIIIQKDPRKAVVLLAYFAQSFTEISNPWPLLDLLISRSAIFIQNGAGADCISTLFHLCQHYKAYAEPRLDNCIQLFLNTINTSNDKQAIKMSYNAICHFFNPEPTIDISILAKHLQDPTLCKYALRLLLLMKHKPRQVEIINALFNYSSLVFQEATLCLCRIAAHNDGTLLCIENHSWISTPLPTIQDTFRLFATTLLHHSLHSRIFSFPEVPKLFILSWDEPRLPSYVVQCFSLIPQNLYPVYRPFFKYIAGEASENAWRILAIACREQYFNEFDAMANKISVSGPPSDAFVEGCLILCKIPCLLRKIKEKRIGVALQKYQNGNPSLRSLITKLK